MRRYLYLLVVLGLAVGISSVALPRDAAKIGQASVSQAALNSDLQTIAKSSTYQCFLRAQLTTEGVKPTPFFPILGAGGSTTSKTGVQSYNSKFAAYWVTQMVTAKLSTTLLTARHLTLTATELVFGRSTLTHSMSQILTEYARAAGGCPGETQGKTVLSTLPTSFVDTLVRNRTALVVVAASLGGSGLTQAALKKYFDSHTGTFVKYCVTEAATASKVTASKYPGDLASGTPFTKLPTATISRGCVNKVRIESNSRLGPILSLKPGAVSTPMTGTSGTAFLYKLTKISAPTLQTPTTAQTVRQIIIGKGASAYAELNSKTRASGALSIDPAIGTTRNGEISPNAVPPVGAVPNNTADTPHVVAPNPASIPGITTPTGAVVTPPTTTPRR